MLYLMDVDFPIPAMPVTAVFVYLSDKTDARFDGILAFPVPAAPITISHCIFLKYNSIKT